jgi:NAD-dependent deacetylase
MTSPLSLADYQRIVVLTGAGISVASGLPTFRGPGGLWERPGASAVATAEMFASEPEKVWSLFGGMRRLALEAEPNAAHRALVALEASALARGATFLVITQNVDRLHQRAGSKAVVEIHGSLFRTKCGNATCDLPPFDDLEPAPAAAQRCERCGAALRPDVVLFDEPIPAKPEWDAKRALRDCDLFIAVGTSGTVSPASNFVRAAAYAGARTILVNLQPMQPRHPDFHEEILGRAEEVLPSWTA